MILRAAFCVVALASGAIFGPGAARAQLTGPQFTGPQSVAPVAERLIDAVVNISTSQKLKGPSGVPLPRVPKGSPFEDLFDDFFDNRGGNQSRKVASLGSGFVIDGTEGLIVTNNHVIEGADEIIANFNDGSQLTVEKVLGIDTKTDLALLKVKPKSKLPEVKFGSSESLKVGDWVLAIGNPFGLGGSVSIGIISAKQRDIQSGPYDDYLQTDAAINKGNSGGPLFNMTGEVIGVNTAIISPTGGSIGIGFAVPSDSAISVLEQLRINGEVRRGWLGVNIQSVSSDVAESLKLDNTLGAFISTVTPDGPAAKAGIKSGDIVVTFDGKLVKSMRALPRLVAETAEGKTVPVELLREGKRQTVSVVVGRLEEPRKEAAAGADATDTTAATDAALGMTLAAIDDDLRREHGLSDKVKGLVVTAVEADGPAAEKEIKVGEVVVEAGGAPIATPDELEAAIAKVKSAGRRQVLLRVEDGKGNTRLVAVKIR